ncbi:trypco2 family protein [Paracoccus marinaquae]|nr:trypco2 family protein [Paracoccus marinaquae]
MRSIILSFPLVLAMVQMAPAETTISLSEMIRDVQGALLDAQTILRDNDMLPLSQVKLTLNTINRTEAGGNVGFWVFVVGASTENSVTSRVEMTLTPPAAGASNPVAASGLIRETLAQAIAEGAAARSVAVQGNPPLEATEFTIALEFALIDNGSGGIALAVPPFTGELSGKISQSNLQRILMDFSE